MKKLQLPSSYAALSPEEQCAAFGGSEFGDAVGSFFDNLHFNDFFWNGGLISFSFTPITVPLTTAPVRIWFNEPSSFSNCSKLTSDITMNLLNNILRGARPCCDTYATYIRETLRL